MITKVTPIVRIEPITPLTTPIIFANSSDWSSCCPLNPASSKFCLKSVVNATIVADNAMITIAIISFKPHVGFSRKLEKCCAKGKLDDSICIVPPIYSVFRRITCVTIF